jgi:hypothetical protein
MTDRTRPSVTADSPIGPDVDLEEDDVRLANRTRLTEQRAAEIVEEVRGRGGRPSLTGEAQFRRASASASPPASTTAPPRSPPEGKTVSRLAGRRSRRGSPGSLRFLLVGERPGGPLPDRVLVARPVAHPLPVPGARHAPPRRRAQRWLDEVTASQVAGTYVDPNTARTTVADWCETWLAGYATRPPRTVPQAQVHVAQIEAAFGPTPLSAVRPSASARGR